MSVMKREGQFLKKIIPIYTITWINFDSKIDYFFQ